MPNTLDGQRSQERLFWIIGVGAFAWFEIQRRLELLNHENARIVTVQEKSVSADKYEANEKARDADIERFVTWQKSVDEDRHTAATRKGDRAGAISSTTKIVGAMAAAVAIVSGVVVVANYTSTSDPAPTVTVTVPR